MDPVEQRAALAALVANRGESLAALSRLLGRNAAYLQQFVTRGSPRELGERDRKLLADYLGVREAELGGPQDSNYIAVPRLDVAASAGPGRFVDAEHRRAASFDPATLRRLGVQSSAASTIRVEGDSMSPTLNDGDEILVDGQQRNVDARGGLYVLRLDGVLMVKRLQVNGKGVDVISDNPDFPPIGVRSTRELEVLGRVVWLGRAL